MRFLRKCLCGLCQNYYWQRGDGERVTLSLAEHQAAAYAAYWKAWGKRPDRSKCRPWCGLHWDEALAAYDAAGQPDAYYEGGLGAAAERRFCSPACRAATL